MRMNARSDSWDELMRQSASLSISNQTTPLISGKLPRNIGMISSIHFALSPPAWRTTFLQSGSAFFRCKERIDFLEHPLEALPAAVLCATVVPIHPGPIDVRMPRVIVHRGPIASIVIGDIRAPNPDYVGCAGGNEEIVNVSIRET
jgi:hypothetical protein